MKKRQFEKFRASEIYCGRCQAVREVRERLLLVLPAGEISAYRCVVCGDTLGTHESKPVQNSIIIKR
jgi:hypothetical protein